MKKIRTILSLSLILFCFSLCGFATDIELSDDSQKRFSQRTDSNSKQSKRLKLSQEQDLTPQVSRVGSTVGKRTLLDDFNAILASAPVPIQAMDRITAEQEDAEGSRKWVRRFDASADDNLAQWHREKSAVVQAIRAANASRNYLPVETNFAVARLAYVFSDGRTEITDLPYFFISGWPANGHTTKISQFAKALSQSKLGEALKPFNKYGMRFITQNYIGDQVEDLRKRSYDPYKTEVSSFMNEEAQKEDSIPQRQRLQMHQAVIQSTNTAILGKLYFHSEQSIWLTVKDEIAKFKAAKNKESKNFLSKKKENPLSHVLLDICTYYDMCWCCGDTLASCCHTNTLGAQVYVRATGCTAYYDQPFGNGYALRDHRQAFAGYENGQGFQLQNGEDTSYKPYIAHSIQQDW